MALLADWSLDDGSGGGGGGDAAVNSAQTASQQTRLDTTRV